MVRILSIISTGCLLGAIGLALIDAERFALASIALLLVALPVGAFLGLRRGYKKAREIAGAAQSFVTGNVQHARIAEIGEPEGLDIDLEWRPPADAEIVDGPVAPA